MPFYSTQWPCIQIRGGLLVVVMDPIRLSRHRHHLEYPFVTVRPTFLWPSLSALRLSVCRDLCFLVLPWSSILLGHPRNFSATSPAAFYTPSSGFLWRHIHDSWFEPCYCRYRNKNRSICSSHKGYQNDILTVFNVLGCTWCDGGCNKENLRGPSYPCWVSAPHHSVVIPQDIDRIATREQFGQQSHLCQTTHTLCQARRPSALTMG